MQFNHVVCGGTFDHFHLGHKKLLEACFDGGKKVTVGITSMAMARPKLYSHTIESYAIRSAYIRNFSENHKKQVLHIKLNDIYGPTLTDASIDAIYVTDESLPGAIMINKERVQIGMKPLSVVIVPFVLADDGKKISSDRIRSGLINRNGLSYYKHLISKDIHIMPESLRGELREPLGRVISPFNTLSGTQQHKFKAYDAIQSYSYLILVGDVITYNHKKCGVLPTISIIDGKTRRKALNKEYIEAILEKDRSIAPNKKGTIQKEAVEALYMLLTSGHNKAINQLLIEGEEDLLTLVAVLLAPLGAHVWYGQQGVGAIDVLVTEKKKQIVYNLVRKFKTAETG